MGEGAPSPLDPTALVRLSAWAGTDEPDLLGDLVGIFLADVPDQLVALRRAAAGDSEGLRRVAHTLKGRCAVLGARGMVELLETLEATACTSRAAAAAELVDRLEADFVRVKAALDTRPPRGAR